MTGVVLLLSIGCGGGSSSTPTPTSPSANVPFSQTDLRVGTGTEAANGRSLTVHYTGWLYAAGQPDQKGRQFDSSVGTQPYTFVLGTGRVIRGWDQGPFQTFIAPSSCGV
jgi:FKBP-type peptidyl-prolyl cis-trans isomerase FkpA